MRSEGFGKGMVVWACPDCGFSHICTPGVIEEHPGDVKVADGKGGKGYSLYYVPCRCGCGCGHTCDLIYGPYAKVYNARGVGAMKGPLGEELRQMRAVSAGVRREHLAKVHNASR